MPKLFVEKSIKITAPASKVWEVLTNTGRSLLFVNTGTPSRRGWNAYKHRVPTGLGSKRLAVCYKNFSVLRRT